MLLTRDGTTDISNVIDSTVALPYSTSATATTTGGTTSTAQYDFSVIGDSGSLEFEFDLLRSGNIDSQNIATGDLFFTVTTPSVFELDGLFNLTGDGYVHVRTVVRDLTVSGGAAGRVYQSKQLSLNTTDQEFVVGGLDGDYINALVGDLPGNLIPTHRYLLQYTYGIITPTDGDDGASATGAFTFNINPGSVVVVPEPSSFAIFLIGVAGLCFLRQQRRRHFP